MLYNIKCILGTFLSGARAVRLEGRQLPSEIRGNGANGSNGPNRTNMTNKNNKTNGGFCSKSECKDNTIK